MYSTYDFEICGGVYNFSFNSGAGNGAGPYSMPTAYLRAANDEIFYTISNEPYKMLPVDKATYDSFNKDPGLTSYPSFFMTDPGVVPTAMYVWPAPAGSYPVTVRYYGSMPALVNPESSTSIPWFPSSMYLLTRLTGELMLLTDDKRATIYLGDGTEQNRGRAGNLLEKVLLMKDDPENLVQTVKLDNKLFRKAKGNANALPNTKTIGF